MILYSDTSKQFIMDNIQNQISQKLKKRFFNHFGYNPSDGEVRSWQNSLRALSQVIQFENLDDHGILLEYQLPLTSKRLDCMITGKDDELVDNAIIVELKQWEKCEESFGENEVCTWVGGRNREVLHPSAQVGQYKMYLEDTHTSFYDEDYPIKLHACSYLHNYHYEKNDAILENKFDKLISKYPLFSADQVTDLSKFLKTNLCKGKGMDVLRKVQKGDYRPSKKLMDHVGNIIKGNTEYILLDEQKIVYDKVFSIINEGLHHKEKYVLIIKGGPGTGKSVIALNLMADLLLKGYNAHYATGSKAFTTTLRKIIGNRGEVQFKYFNSYMECQDDEVDVLICDESHRIRRSSNNRFTRNRSDKEQIEELINASRVSVFFIDDDQIVRPNEVGSVDYIENAAEAKNCKLWGTELEAQFRCKGSDGFVNWINNTLAIQRTANALWYPKDEEFDFQIKESPIELENAIKEKIVEGHTGRLTAGFCWKWSRDRNDDNSLIKDVKIGSFHRPWNARADATRLPRDVPKADVWAYDPNGINQIGCVYTAQGFEFDYVGVIFGNDLIYDFDSQQWVGDKSNSYDTVVKRSGDQFIDLVKNTYRVLLSRGMKGCYVYFVDKNTENFFKSRMAQTGMV